MRMIVFAALIAVAGCGQQQQESSPVVPGSTATPKAATGGRETNRLPRIRPGLWEIASTSTKNPNFSIRSCVNEEVQDEILHGGTACQNIYRPGSRSFSITCNFGDGITTTEGSYSGNFRENYSWEAVTTEPGLAPYTESGEAIFRGECPEGWMPGDQEAAGRRIYLSEWRAAMRSMAEGR